MNKHSEDPFEGILDEVQRFLDSRYQEYIEAIGPLGDVHTALFSSIWNDQYPALEEQSKVEFVDGTANEILFQGWGTIVSDAQEIYRIVYQKHIYSNPTYAGDPEFINLGISRSAKILSDNRFFEIRLSNSEINGDGEVFQISLIFDGIELSGLFVIRENLKSSFIDGLSIYMPDDANENEQKEKQERIFVSLYSTFPLDEQTIRESASDATRIIRKAREEVAVVKNIMEDSQGGELVSV